jgi:hypothetical protein
MLSSDNHLERQGSADAASNPAAPTPFFTGRVTLLPLMYTSMVSAKDSGQPAHIALYGLAGIGKTQVALAYAHDYRHFAYREVLWARASSREQLLTDFAAIATSLGLTHEGQGNTGCITAVHAWMKRYRRWLLILDGIEESGLLDEFLPPTHAAGHILWTTRTRTCLHGAMAIAVERLPLPDAMRLLFNRARGQSPSITNWTQTMDCIQEMTSKDSCPYISALASAMGGYPLALDRVGEYLHESGERLADCALRYHIDPMLVLGVGGRQGEAGNVSANETLVGELRRVASESPAALNLLRTCAFLAEAPLPLEVTLEMVRDLDPQERGEYDEQQIERAAAVAMEPLLDRSLMTADDEALLFVVPQVLAQVAIGAMDEQERQRCAERAIRASYRALTGEGRDPFRIQQLRTHMQSCLDLIERWEMSFPEAIHLRSQFEVQP